MACLFLSPFFWLEKRSFLGIAGDKKTHGTDEYINYISAAAEVHELCRHH